MDGGYDPVYGARPLKRFLQHSIETVLARKIIAEDPEPGTVYVADVKGRRTDHSPCGEQFPGDSRTLREIAGRINPKS